MTHTDKAVWRKIGEIEGWEMCIMEAVTGGVLITGGVPKVVKGKKKWPPKKLMERVLLTRTDVEVEQVRYETETGNCHVCYGTGQETAGWHHIDGPKLRECPKCKGTGSVTPS